MDFGIIFGLVILIIIALAVVISNSSKKNKKKQLVKLLYDFAGKSHCKISEHDLWNNTLIGIDKDRHKLFFIRMSGENEVKTEIDLQGIQKCRVINSNRVVTSGDSVHTVTDKLELALTSPDTKIADTILEFYNTNRDNLFLNGELQLTDKWAEIVNANISGISHKR
jgi:ribonucleotide monophosphatase NagD (HAD superfamily)